MYEVAQLLASAWRWLAGAIRPKRKPTNHRPEDTEERS